MPRSQYERKARVPARFVITEWTRFAPRLPAPMPSFGWMPRCFQAPQAPTCLGSRRIGDLEDAEVGLARRRGRVALCVVVRRGQDLRPDDRGVDERAAAGGPEPDLVRAARLRAHEGELTRLRRPGHVREHETVEGGLRARLQARHGQVAGEGGRLDVPDDRLLRPRPRDAGEARDRPRPARVADVDHPDALRRAPRSEAIAREVGVSVVPEDVRRVRARSGVHVREGLELRRLPSERAGPGRRRARSRGRRTRRG